MKVKCSICLKNKDRSQFKLGKNKEGKLGIMKECYSCRKLALNDWRFDEGVYE